MVIERYIAAQRADGYAANTIRARVNCIKAIAKYFGLPPDAIRPDHVQTYFSSRSLTNWTRRTYLNHLASFGRWLGNNLIEGLRKPPAPRSTPDPIAEGDLRDLLRSTRRPDHKAWVLLGAFCGLRAHETAKLRAEDLHETGDGQTVLRVVGKGGRTDVIPVPPVVLAALDREGRGRFWPDLRPEKVSRSISRAAAAIGVKMRYHQLRHRFGTAVYRASGQDLLMTQRLMRHASPATTAGYAAVADDRFQDVVRDLPGALAA
ncbi:tyrosine-type recombinase/integrase [Actinocorallia sp. A-T 12471]|uniref:tyrosine-type recombinase/integrase n=1 Tax=Actinocorallia sp. A-T 12471 TaxID=3089813 RepID=UPI0029D2B495|nr:tyrosine-type recombinase/integrase [Actinocorallia sp. A-T 12471]MDX6739039.1 tyrosine-type recombinase/integrase [Actinocorallia sp. A-T 12471]